MSILPPNKRKVAKETLLNFDIFGGTMNVKTYIADNFPNPLNINTDRNADMIETPSINLRNERDVKGNITTPASEKLIKAITELEAGNHTYETIVLDVIDDIITLFEQEITEEHNVKNIGDIGWGKGHSTQQMMVRVLVMRLKELTMKTGMNVLYLSRLTTIVENDVEQHVPSLPLKWMNIINGNSDYTILCRKVGKNYIRRAVDKRKNFDREKVDDERILNLLDTVSGAFEKSRKTSKKEQEDIVKEQEKQQEAERLMRQRERDAALKEGDEPKKEKPKEAAEPKEEDKPKETRPRRRRPRRAATSE